MPEPVDTPKEWLQQLGWMLTRRTFVSLDDGTIWHSDPDQDVGYELINSHLSSPAYVLYKVMAEAPTRRVELPSPDDWEGAENVVRADTRRWGPVPFSDPDGFWPRYLDEYQRRRAAGPAGVSRCRGRWPSGGRSRTYLTCLGRPIQDSGRGKAPQTRSSERGDFA
ncbi:SUKH-4 family immunity protein [Actinoallomurus sp. NPDC052308]|uniref:SUKH-4 family immunity protein n=1 Tax=Actinoallomurus sp. NPDC052308 TaxID=3155530 RepID=UPI0034394ABA